jgi:hypothetical protein
VLRNSATNQKKFNFLKHSRNSLNETTVKRPPALSMTSPKASYSSSVTELSRPRTLFSSTPKAGSAGFNFHDVASRDSTDEDGQVMRFLRVQAVKLKEREEYLDRDKEKWMQKWNRLPVANELIPMVQQEMLELKQRRSELEGRVREMDSRELELSLLAKRIQKQDVEIQSRTREVGEVKERMEEERKMLVQRLGRLREDIEIGLSR